jgi:hypothetical protein
MVCPQCGSAEIRDSRSTHWNDIFHRVRGLEAFRCRKCRQRFYASTTSESVPKQVVQAKNSHRPKKLMSERSKKRLVRRLVVVTIFAAAFIIFWFFLRYLTTERMPASDSGAVNSPAAYSVV